MLLQLPDGSHVDPSRVSFIATGGWFPAAVARHGAFRVVVRCGDDLLYVECGSEAEAEADAIRDEIALAVCAATGRPAATTGQMVRRAILRMAEAEAEGDTAPELPAE